MRDDPGFVLPDFKRKFKENLKVTIPAGIFCTLIFYGETSQLFLRSKGVGIPADPFLLTFNLIALVLIGMVMPYLFLQIPYINIRPVEMIKNAFLLAIIHLPRSLMGFIQGGIIWAVYAIFFPWSVIIALPVLVFIPFTLSWLLTLMWIWKPVDEHFKIEETMKAGKDV